MPRRTRLRRTSSARRAAFVAAVETFESRLFLSAGDLDTTFGSFGKVDTGFPGALHSGARDAALQSDGRVIVLTEGEDGDNARLARFTANGQPDTTFGTGGVVVLPFQASAFAVRADNKIVVAGPADADNVRLARFTASGQLDTTFAGGDGEVTQPYFGGATTGPKQIAKVLIQPATNRIYVAGSADPNDVGLHDFALAAFNDDGTRYEQFGDTAQFTTLTDFGNDDTLSDLTFAPNGDLIAVGAWTISDSHHPFYLQDYAVVRWDEHGIPVTSFSGDGKATVGFGVSPVSTPPSFDTDSLFDFAQSVAVDAAGNIVVAGLSRDPQDDNPVYTSLARLKPDGTLDASFGPGGAEGDGRVLLPLTALTFASVNDVAVLPTGKLLVAAAAPGAGDIDFALARLSASGSLDSSFGTGGKVTTDIDNDDLPRQLLLQSGKALLVGAATHLNTQPGPLSSNLVMARYLLDDTATQTPFTGVPINLPGTLQFENYDNGGEGVAYHDTEPENLANDYRDGGVDVEFIPGTGGEYDVGFAKAGEWVEYTVNVPANQAGTYNVALRYASLRGGGKFHLEVDGARATPVTTLGSTGDWQKYATTSLGSMSLTAGTHVIRLAMDANDSTGYVGNFDFAQFARETGTAQTPFGGKPVRVTPSGVIEFENFDDGGEGVAYHDTDAVNRGGAYRNTGVDVQAIPAAGGGGYNLGFAKAGEWTEYTIEVNQGGAYDLALVYASLRGGGKFHLEVDGKAVTPVVTVASTGDWQAYRSLAIKGVNLPVGQHVLRLAMDGNDSTGYVANFDRVQFSQVMTRTPFRTPFVPNQQIEAEDFDLGGEGVAYHDTEPQNRGGQYRVVEGVDIEAAAEGGYDVGFARPGEYLTYSLDVPTAGTFGVHARVASLKGGGRFHVEIDGARVADFAILSTGGWQTYTTLTSAKNVAIGAGSHALKLVMDQADPTGFVANFNWMKVVS